MIKTIKELLIQWWSRYNRIIVEGSNKRVRKHNNIMRNLVEVKEPLIENGFTIS